MEVRNIFHSILNHEEEWKNKFWKKGKIGKGFGLTFFRFILSREEENERDWKKEREEKVWKGVRCPFQLVLLSVTWSYRSPWKGFSLQYYFWTLILFHPSILLLHPAFNPHPIPLSLSFFLSIPLFLAPFLCPSHTMSFYEIFTPFSHSGKSHLLSFQILLPLHLH